MRVRRHYFHYLPLYAMRMFLLCRRHRESAVVDINAHTGAGATGDDMPLDKKQIQNAKQMLLYGELTCILRRCDFDGIIFIPAYYMKGAFSHS